LGYFVGNLTAVLPTASSYVKRLQRKGVGAALVRGAGASFVIQVMGASLHFVTHIVLARTLGASSYGNYAYALSWMGILVLFGKLGLDTASLRFVAEYNGTQKWGLLKGFVERSTQVVLATSTLVALSAAVVIWTIRDRLQPELAATFWVACLILPLFSLLQIRSAALRGLKNIVASQSTVQIVRPLLLLAGVGAVYFLSREALNATTAMAVNLAAFAGALLFVAVFFKKVLPSEVARAHSESMTMAWTRVALPMFFISGMMQTQNQADILIMGFLLDSCQIGIYIAAKQTCTLIVFGLAAVNTIAMPMIAELWHQGRKKELQRLLTLAARGIFAFTLPVSLALIIFGKQALFLFGPEFTAAYWPLVIICGGQIVNSLVGPVGAIMTMSGHQNSVVFILAISVASNIVLNFLLTPSFAIIGAAIAMSLTLIIWNVLMYLYVIKRLGLNSTLFAF